MFSHKFECEELKVKVSELLKQNKLSVLLTCGAELCMSLFSMLSHTGHSMAGTALHRCHQPVCVHSDPQHKDYRVGTW